MGSKVIIDDDDRVIDAVDKSVVGKILDRDLGALVARIPDDKPCLSDSVGEYDVTVCIEGLRVRGQPKHLDFNIDHTRDATVNQLELIASSPGVKSVRVVAGKPPQINLESGAVIVSTYAPASKKLATEVALRAKENAKERARICRSPATAAQAKLCASRT